MTKIAKESLFELIKSLTKGERRSFKQFANYASSGDKKYLRLFEIIDQQKQYDEDAIKQRLKKEKIRRPLPSMKNYLLELISKSLQFHYSGSSVDLKIREHLSAIEIYNNKGLKELRDRTLGKVKHLAEKYEKYEASLTILNLELGFGNKTFSEKKNILLELEQLNKKIVSIRKYRELGYSIEELAKKGKVRDEKHRKQWDELIRSPLINTTGEPSGYEEKYFYHGLWRIYYRVNDNNKMLNYHAEKYVNYLESRPELLIENKRRYMAALNGLVIAFCLNKKNSAAKEAFDKLLRMQNWKLNGNEKNDLADHTILAFNNLLMESIQTNNFIEGLSWAKQAENYIKNNSVTISYRSILHYNLSILYFNTGNHNTALTWNELFLNENPEKYNEDLYHFSKLLNLIIHFELQHNELVPDLVRSTYRFLYKNKKLFKTEDAILRFIRIRLPKANSPKELIHFFKLLKSELEEISKDPYEAKALELFDFISWLESKIKKRPFAEILKEKSDKILY